MSDLIEEAQRFAEELFALTGQYASVSMGANRYAHGMKVKWDAWLAKYNEHIEADSLPELRTVVMARLDGSKQHPKSCPYCNRPVLPDQPLNMVALAAEACGIEPCAP